VNAKLCSYADGMLQGGDPGALEFTPEKDPSATSLAAESTDEQLSSSDGPNTPKRACRCIGFETS